MPTTCPAAMRATDTLARRLRFSRPNPRVQRLELVEADLLLFEAIDRHGPLPTGYLYEYTHHLRRDFSHLQNRLTELYNGDLSGKREGGWILRPPQQFANFEARYQPIVHGLAPRGRLALAERGTASPFTAPSGHFVHQLMVACIGASIELAASRSGIRYIPREEIFAHANCRASRESQMPLGLSLGDPGRRMLIPDDLFGFHYAEGGYRFFALEADRQTESIVSTRNRPGAFSTKLAGYRQVLARRLYCDWWGIPNLTVLTVTTNRSHAERLIEQVRQVGDYVDRFAFAVEPSFGTSWRVPRQMMGHLLTAPWMTASGSRDISKV